MDSDQASLPAHDLPCQLLFPFLFWLSSQTDPQKVRRYKQACQAQVSYERIWKVWIITCKYYNLLLSHAKYPVPLDCATFWWESPQDVVVAIKSCASTSSCPYIPTTDTWNLNLAQFFMPFFFFQHTNLRSAKTNSRSALGQSVGHDS